MEKKIDINSEKSEKSFRNFIKNLRKRTANEMMKNKMITKLNQKKMR